MLRVLLSTQAEVFLALIALLAACGAETQPEESGSESFDRADGGPPSGDEGGDTVDVDVAADSDGDGVSDVDEINGWEIVVDEHGYGVNSGSELLGRRHVSSNPHASDTDGDGLDDLEEREARSDPRSIDTDSDGLNDREEVQRYRSNPASVDTDGDSRGPTGDDQPLHLLFDGAEVKSGTSPTLEDTDGDSWTDHEELHSGWRDARIAEVPRVQMEVVSDLSVHLNVTYTEASEAGGQWEHTYETTEGTSSSTSDTRSTQVTIAASSGGDGFFDDLEFSPKGALSFLGGKALEIGREVRCGFVGGGGAVFDSEDPSGFEDAVNAVGGAFAEIASFQDSLTGMCDEATPETVNTTSITLTKEAYKEAREAYTEIRSESNSHTEAFSTGVVGISMRFTNMGDSAFTLVNPTVTMSQLQTGLSGRTGLKTMATLMPQNGIGDGNGNQQYTLAVGESVEVHLQNDDVNGDIVKAFLADPQALFFSPSNFELTNAQGANYDFLTNDAARRTATVVIDRGDGEVTRHQVATDVDRSEDGAPIGVAMRTALQDILGLPYEVIETERANDAGEPVRVDVLVSLDGIANARSANLGDHAAGVPGDAQCFWVLHAPRKEQIAPEVSFGQIRIMAGDEVRLVYLRDMDGDGLSEREEALRGTSDQTHDSDSDGLSDFQEIRVGWPVTIRYTKDGQETSITYRVTSNPLIQDSDGDGVVDAEEMRRQLDPRRSDSDDDGYPDGLEVDPLNSDDSRLITGGR